MCFFSELIDHSVYKISDIYGKAVISLTDTAEWKGAERVVHHNIVHRHSSARSLLNHPFYGLGERRRGSERGKDRDKEEL